MITCNNCGRNEDEVKIIKKTEICVKCRRKIYRIKNKEYNNQYNKEYYEENKKTINENKRKYYEENKDIIIDYRRKYYKKNKDIIIENNKEYYEENKEDIKEYSKKYYEENKEIIKVKMRNYYEENKEIIKIKNKYSKEYSKKYYEENKKKILSRRKYRMSNDLVCKLSFSIKNSIRNSFKSKNLRKVNKTTEILGCSFIDFKIYIESKFESWMTWDNKGLYNGELNYGWDIDHIIPLSSAKTKEDIIMLNHYTNLQPLCSYTNRHIKRDIVYT